MDPQLEEIRRKQKERFAAAAASTNEGRSRTFRNLAIFSLIFTAMLMFAARGVGVGGVDAAPVSMTGGAAGSVTGQCPDTDGMVGMCVEECSGHQDCAAEGKLCCSNGCGHVCMAPETPGPKKPSGRQCTILAILEKTEAVDAVMEAAPKPDSHNLMASIGILSVTYQAGRAHDCCKAFKALGAREEVSSVEYDGKPPDCHKEL
mmetsp:Transcript_17053/g.32023  ORF Transcript_17053/g.32023 Transcript_17053/m.32023 type:complete len:204 (-) Transcript_17053:83-694(-)